MFGGLHFENELFIPDGIQCLFTQVYKIEKRKLIFMKFDEWIWIVFLCMDLFSYLFLSLGQHWIDINISIDGIQIYSYVWITACIDKKKYWKKKTSFIEFI